ncbi:hypothetical protein [Tenacibaculum maritimum]|uniref:hypothetical protein n=1 Tax=Tenacibaculum maritimum TaxID=107401 RepID=UPI0012E543F2|nr:hypothetical protein [Tenacibaculum maritimum]CAA0193883.1 membrane hypothetical protein [Tenacibaculum maritimum]
MLVIGITATFPHRLFLGAPDNPNIIKLNKERASLKRFWTLKEIRHDSLFKNELITKVEYFNIKDINEKKRIADFKEISKKRKSYALSFSFNGRSSKNHWFWVFGVLISLLITSCFLAIKDARLKKAGLLKWYEPHASVAFILVSLFWLYHTIFKTSNDFELSIYTLNLLFILIPISYFLYHFLRRTIRIEDKLLENIRDLVSYILKNTKDDKEEEKWELLDKVSRNGR